MKPSRFCSARPNVKRKARFAIPMCKLPQIGGNISFFFFIKPLMISFAANIIKENYFKIIWRIRTRKIMSNARLYNKVIGKKTSWREIILQLKSFPFLAFLYVTSSIFWFFAYFETNFFFLKIYGNLRGSRRWNILRR